jgi:hypothetical protein
MSHPVNNQQYIEIYFNGAPDFGKKTSCTIPRHGIGMNQILLKFFLPILPENLQYKKDLAYHLIKSIQIEIGGTTYYAMTNKYLKLIDGFRKKNLERFILLKKNILYYPIDIDEIFINGKFINKSQHELLDENYNGFRLLNNNFSEIRLIVEIGRINEILQDFNENDNITIDNNILKIKDHLPELSLIDVTCFVNYYMKELATTSLINSEIYQQVCHWECFCENNMISEDIKTMNIKLILPLVFGKILIKKFAFYVENFEISKYILFVNGVECCDQFDPDEMNTIYEYNNNVIVNDIYIMDVDIDLKQNYIMSLKITSDKILPKNFKIHYMFYTMKDVLYKDGWFYYK